MNSKNKTVTSTKDGITVEINLCKTCGAVPYINSMPHGERWIDCDCGESSGLFEDDNCPYRSFQDAVQKWNRKRGKRKKK